jgi:hypothetical protein
MNRRLLLLAAALTALAGCAARPPPATREILDPDTGNTLFVATRPLEFARNRADVAAYTRDYVTLVAVAVNDSGKYNEYLLMYRWSTVDRRMLPPPDPGAGELRILADGRTVKLDPLDQVPLGLAARAELHEPNPGHTMTHAYKIDLATLHFLAASQTLVVRMPQEALDTPFELWRDGRPDLERFVTAQGERHR